MHHRKPRKIETKKLRQDLWCVDMLKSYPEVVLPEKCCFNNIAVFTISEPDSQEMNIAFALDDLFEFKQGKRYKVSIEEVPWNASTKPPA